MLEVKTPEEVLRLIEKVFYPADRSETVSLAEALGRVLAEDVSAEEYVPDFDRSTVDGYALHAKDTFGCSDAIPAVLNLAGEVKMGEGASVRVPRDACAYVPTGGAIPEGCDCVVMIEYTEDYGDGTIGILKPGVPGMNLIFRGDDVFPGKKVLSAGRVLAPQDIGALAAIGKTQVSVRPQLRVGVISTGDELVPADRKPVYFSYIVDFRPQELGLDIPAPKFKAAMIKILRAEGIGFSQWQTRPVPSMEIFQHHDAYGKGCPWNCPHYKGFANYNPSQYPVTKEFIANHSYLHSLYPPNDLGLVDLYVQGFEKVISQPEKILEVANSL